MRFFSTLIGIYQSYKFIDLSILCWKLNLIIPPWTKFKVFYRNHLSVCLSVCLCKFVSGPKVFLVWILLTIFGTLVQRVLWYEIKSKSVLLCKKVEQRSRYKGNIIGYWNFHHLSSWMTNPSLFFTLKSRRKNPNILKFAFIKIKKISRLKVAYTHILSKYRKRFIVYQLDFFIKGK